MFGNLTASNCGIHLERFFFLYTFPYNPCNAQPALVLAEVNIPWCFQNTGQNHVNRMQLNRLCQVYIILYIKFLLFCFVLFDYDVQADLELSIFLPQFQNKKEKRNLIYIMLCTSTPTISPQSIYLFVCFKTQALISQAALLTMELTLQPPALKFWDLRHPPPSLASSLQFFFLIRGVSSHFVFFFYVKKRTFKY